MFEIIVGLIALVFLYRFFPKKRDSDHESSILPIIDEETLTADRTSSKSKYYDWAYNIKDVSSETEDASTVEIDDGNYNEIDDVDDKFCG